MANKLNLRQALKQTTMLAEPASPGPQPVPAPGRAHRTAGSRDAKAHVGGYYPPEVNRQLRILAADERTTIEDLLAEALNDLFQKHGRPEIAPRKTRR